MGLFDQMQQEGIDANNFVFVQVVNACAGLQDLEKGKIIHGKVVEMGCESDSYLGNSLVDMYAKCGSIEDAWRVFKDMQNRNVVAWNAMIMGCVKCGQVERALELSLQMEQEGVVADSLTFVALLKACAGLLSLEKGRFFHKRIILSGCECNIFVGSSLVDMYAKCGSLEDAWRVFSKMPSRNEVTWNAMILGYVNCGHGKKALSLFRQMQNEGVDTTAVTFVGLLKACTSLGALEEGKFLHEHIIRRGYESGTIVGGSLVDMYAKCGSIEDARRVFNRMPSRSVVAWNTMILGYVKCGQGQKALELFQQMESDGVNADSVTFVGLLNACASLGAVQEGRRFHELIVQSGCESDIFVGSSLIDMYAKGSSIEDAWTVFKNMPKRNVVAWNAMILGYVKCGLGHKALTLFKDMQQAGVDATSVTFVGLLNACASIAGLEEGRCVHEKITHSGLELDIHVGNSLVDMYAKCGSIEEASKVFDKMPVRNVVGWNAMIGGYAMHGHARVALSQFERMRIENVTMDEVTFICLLSGCSHGGLVEEGLRYFKSMATVYGISPTIKHYTCMVDLLGRADRLSDAEEMLTTMSVKLDASVWMSLLNACRIHGNVEIGERAAKRVLELDPENASGYVLLSNIYAAAGD